MRLPTSWLMLALLLAGCASPSATDDAAGPAAAPDGAAGADGPAAGAPPADAGSAAPPSDASPAAAVETFTFAGNVTGASAVATVPSSLDDLESIGFDVRPGAQAIRVTLAWDGEGDLDAGLQSPGWCPDALDADFVNDEACWTESARMRRDGHGWFHGAGGDAASPDSPSVVEVGAAELEAWGACGQPACTWRAHAWANVAAAANYTLLVEVFYGPPAGAAEAS